MKHNREELKQWQSLPLTVKIAMTKERIRAWINEYGEDGVYISFSGGKDSTVLLDIVRQDYPDIPAVFVDVPTQYPELRDFAKTFDNVEIIRPKISFMEVCERYGFPLVSKEIAHKMNDWYSAHKHGHECYVDRQFEGTFKTKNGKTNMISITKYAFLKDADFQISHMCCNIMKKDPLKRYEKETHRMPITAQMAEESALRAKAWFENGCNMYDIKRPISNPMAFWTEQDVLTYIHTHHIPICSVYGEVVEDDQLSLFENKQYKTTGCDRTGCMLCGFGCHLEKSPTRFERLKETHPGMYGMLDRVKNNGVTMREAIDWVNEHGNMNIKY